MVPESFPIPCLKQFSANGSSGEIFTPEKSSQLNLNSEMPVQSMHRQNAHAAQVAAMRQVAFQNGLRSRFVFYNNAVQSKEVEGQSQA